MARLGFRHQPRLGGPLAAGLWAVLVVLGMVGPVAGLQPWTVTADTMGVPLGTSTHVRLTVTNLASLGSGIACVAVTIPSQYYWVSAVSIASTTTGLHWSAAKDGSLPGVTASANQNLDRLMTLDWVVLDVTVVGKKVGGSGWTAVEFSNANCVTGSDFNALPILMTVVGLPTADPTPTPSRTPSPAPSQTQTPTPTPTPIVTLPPIPTPGLTPTPTPSPSTRPTTEPSPTPNVTRGPGASPSPTPTPAPIGQGSGPGSPGAGGAGGSGGPGPAPSPNRRRLDVPAADPGLRRPIDTGGVPGFEVFDWAIPGVILTGPGFLLIVLILAQAMGALAWLPVVRKRIGAFGFGRRRQETE